jgi:hypothetical protein
MMATQSLRNYYRIERSWLPLHQQSWHCTDEAHLLGVNPAESYLYVRGLQNECGVGRQHAGDPMSALAAAILGQAPHAASLQT